MSRISIKRRFDWDPSQQTSEAYLDDLAGLLSSCGLFGLSLEQFAREAHIGHRYLKRLSQRKTAQPLWTTVGKIVRVMYAREHIYLRRTDMTGETTIPVLARMDRRTRRLERIGAQQERRKKEQRQKQRKLQRRYAAHA